MAKVSDARLAAYAVELERIKNQKNKWAAEETKVKDIILGELDRRGTHLVESNGWRITRAQGTTVVTDYEALRIKLTLKQRKLVSRTIVDPKAVAAAVAGGQIDAGLVDSVSTIKPKAAYVVVNRI